jgi:hypothetical protein
VTSNSSNSDTDSTSETNGATASATSTTRESSDGSNTNTNAGTAGTGNSSGKGNDPSKKNGANWVSSSSSSSSSGSSAPKGASGAAGNKKQKTESGAVSTTSNTTNTNSSNNGGGAQQTGDKEWEKTSTGSGSRCEKNSDGSGDSSSGSMGVSMDSNMSRSFDGLDEVIRIALLAKVTQATQLLDVCKFYIGRFPLFALQRRPNIEQLGETFMAVLRARAQREARIYRWIQNDAQPDGPRIQVRFLPSQCCRIHLCLQRIESNSSFALTILFCIRCLYLQEPT